MLWSDIRPALFGAAGAAFIWFVGYVAKHLLDRLVLPRFLDWLATRNRRGALARANLILDTLHSDIWAALSIHHALARATITVLVTLSGYTMLLFLGLLTFQFLLQPWEALKEHLSTSVVVFYVVCAAGIGLPFVLLASSEQLLLRRRESLENPSQQVKLAHQRARELLVAASVPERDIEQLLATSRKVIEQACAFRAQPLVISFEPELRDDKTTPAT